VGETCERRPRFTLIELLVVSAIIAIHDRLPCRVQKVRAAAQPHQGAQHTSLVHQDRTGDSNISTKTGKLPRYRRVTRLPAVRRGMLRAYFGHDWTGPEGGLVGALRNRPLPPPTNAQGTFNQDTDYSNGVLTQPASSCPTSKAIENLQVPRCI